MHARFFNFPAVQQMEERQTSAMICDIHVHIAGNWIAPAFRNRLLFRLFACQFGLSPNLNEQILTWLETSEIDRAVLLAFDGAYRRDGSHDEANTLVVTENDFVAGIAASHRKALFGASVHPYRRDALQETERLIERGAVLMKWLPGAQNIQPDDPICFPYYEMLARYRVPLLCHTGAEHALKRFPNTLNDPKRLIPALERGVTVIAAHCGARMMLHEKCYLRDWCEMAVKYANFYGDISAFGLPVRAWALRKLLAKPEFAEKLVYGSDFPAPVFPWSFLGRVRLRRIREIRRIQNPFDRAFQLMKAAGVPDAVFSRAMTLLRIE